MLSSPARRLRDALEPIAQQGVAARPVRARLKALGLSGIEGYVWGRAASLGEPSAAVVVATFGVFEPTFLAPVYESARGKASRDAVLAARNEGVAEGLGTLLEEAPDLGWAGDTLLDASTGVSYTARPLFAGLCELSVPPDPYGRLWRGADRVREHRGDSHLAACIAAGLTPVEMNILTELWIGYPLGEYSTTRQHGQEAIDQGVQRLSRRGWLHKNALTDAGHEARDGIERATDAAQDQLIENIGANIERLIDTLSAIAHTIVAAGAFTDDEKKRAAG